MITTNNNKKKIIKLSNPVHLLLLLDFLIHFIQFSSFFECLYNEMKEKKKRKTFDFESNFFLGGKLPEKKSQLSSLSYTC